MESHYGEWDMVPARDPGQMDRLIEVGLDEVAEKGMSATPTAIQLASSWWMVRTMEQTVPKLVVQAIEQRKAKPRNIILKLSPWAGVATLGGLIVEVINRLAQK